MVKRAFKQAPTVCGLGSGGCASCADKILLWTLGLNAMLSVVKICGGFIASSSGLFADGLQSVACVLGTLLIMYSVNLSKRVADRKFPFGYGKVEFIVSLVVFSVLVGLGVYIFISNLLTIVRKEAAAPGIVGLPFSVLSAFLTYMMFRYNRCAAQKLDSSAMMANALNAKADMLSSIAVTIGILISQLGQFFAVFDSLAALLVGILIFKDAVEQWLHSVKALLDEAPEPGYREKVQRVLAKALPGRRVGAIRIKRTGNRFWIGVGIDPGETGTVEETARLTDRIRKDITKSLPWVQTADFFLEPSHEAPAPAA
ncbi:MAG: cation transporter [Candidatus Omnitrophica bacterium]|nr:cation transporter [Candidatus Omnitrophota bacterium]